MLLLIFQKTGFSARKGKKQTKKKKQQYYLSILKQIYFKTNLYNYSCSDWKCFMCSPCKHWLKHIES